MMAHLTQWLHVSQLSTVIALLIFCGIQIAKVKHLGVSRVALGFHLQHSREAVLTTVLATLTFCLLLLVIKAVAIHKLPVLSQLPVFDVDTLPASISMSHAELLSVMAVVYALFCPFQVFLVHCAFQGPLMDILPARIAKWVSIIASVIFMSVVHIPVGPIFALAVIVPSLLWGYLYAQYRSAPLIILSHITIGIWALFFLGYQHLFHILGAVL